MAKKFKIGQKFTNAQGDKVVITSILPNGAATVNYASGSGKTGFAGMIPANMLTKYGTRFTNSVQKDFLEPADLNWQNDEFSYEEYEQFTQEHPDEDPTEVLNKELSKAQAKNLANIEEVIDKELLPPFKETAEYLDTRFLVRHTNQAVRYMLKEYSSAYGDSDEFELAKKKLSTVYHMSQAGGYHHVIDDGEKTLLYDDPKVFYPDFKEAVALLKDRNTTEADLETFRAKIGLCKYGFSEIGHSRDYCENTCSKQVERYQPYDLPQPIW